MSLSWACSVAWLWRWWSSPENSAGRDQTFRVQSWPPDTTNWLLNLEKAGKINTISMQFILTFYMRTCLEEKQKDFVFRLIVWHWSYIRSWNPLSKACQSWVSELNSHQSKAHFFTAAFSFAESWNFTQSKVIYLLCYMKNFRKICGLKQMLQMNALGTCTKFQLEILTANVISGSVYFREIILESLQNVGETAHDPYLENATALTAWVWPWPAATHLKPEAVWFHTRTVLSCNAEEGLSNCEDYVGSHVKDCQICMLL